LDKRDRAIIALLLLTCARVDSIASLKLRHIDLGENVVHFDAGEVRTKQRRTFSVWFFPVDAIAREIVAEWVRHLRDDLGFTEEDPLFPATAQIVGETLQFTNHGLSRIHWTTTDPIRTIVKKRLIAAGQPYFHPHLFRKTIARLGEQLCRTPEEFKAWSQNMAHKQVLTTFYSYCEVPAARQAELIRSVAAGSDDANSAGSRARLLRKLADEIEGDQI
jgi:integrase